MAAPSSTYSASANACSVATIQSAERPVSGEKTRQPKRRRLWLNDGPCVRVRPDRPNYVRAYDFVEDHTRDGLKFHTLNVVDKFTRKALAIRMGCQLKATDVIEVLADLFIARGMPGHIRSDNGPEFAAIVVKSSVTAVGARAAYIEPDNPRETGYVELMTASSATSCCRARSSTRWRKPEC